MPSLAQSKSHISPAHRGQALDRLASESYDVIVVGGGVTGTGVALDAASRGLKTALVERVDLAAGTSRWSSKLVHGGLRYLAKGDVVVAWESAVERHRLMTTIAPHLCRPEAFLNPLTRSSGRLMGLAVRSGLLMGDAMRRAAQTPDSLLAKPKRLSVSETLRYAPALSQPGLTGGLLYWDGQLVDDARLVTCLAMTARGNGADIVTRCGASDLKEDQVTLTDRDTGTSFLARGQVINATGVWASEHQPGLTMSPSLGSHLVVRAETMGNPQAVFTVPVPGHFGRFLLVLPQLDGLCLIGLTDEPADGVDGIAPEVPAHDEAFLLDTLNRSLKVAVRPEDIVGRFAGVRPLVRFAAGNTPDISRKHLLADDPGCPVTITGGKLTTYRRMAQDAVDAACRRLGREIPCRTTSLALVGAADASALAEVNASPRLVRRYGTLAAEVMQLAAAETWLAEPVADGCPTIGAEFAYGLLAEGAATVEDLIERRTRVSLVDAYREPAGEVAQRVLESAGELQKIASE